MNKVFILTAFFSVILSGCASSSKDMDNMLKTINEDNPSEYEAVLKDFFQSGKDANVERMVSLTSDITIKSMGKEKVVAFYKGDLVPAFKKCSGLSFGGDVIHVTKAQSGTGSGWVYTKYCVNPEVKNIKIRFILLKESGKIVVTSVGAV